MLSFPCEQPGGVRAGGRQQLPYGPGQGPAAVPRRHAGRQSVARGRERRRGNGRAGGQTADATDCWVMAWFPTSIPGEGPLGGSPDRSAALRRRLEPDRGLRHARALDELSATTAGCRARAASRDALVPAGPSGRPGTAVRGLPPARPSGSATGPSQRGVRKIAAALEEVRTVTVPVPELALFSKC